MTRAAVKWDVLCLALLCGFLLLAPQHVPPDARIFAWPSLCAVVAFGYVQVAGFSRTGLLAYVVVLARFLIIVFVSVLVALGTAYWLRPHARGEWQLEMAIVLGTAAAGGGLGFATGIIARALRNRVT